MKRVIVVIALPPAARLHEVLFPLHTGLVNRACLRRARCRLWIGLLLFCVPAAIYAIGWLGVGQTCLRERRG